MIDNNKVVLRSMNKEFSSDVYNDVFKNLNSLNNSINNPYSNAFTYKERSMIKKAISSQFDEEKTFNALAGKVDLQTLKGVMKAVHNIDEGGFYCLCVNHDAEVLTTIKNLSYEEKVQLVKNLNISNGDVSKIPGGGSKFKILLTTEEDIYANLVKQFSEKACSVETISTDNTSLPKPINDSQICTEDHFSPYKTSNIDANDIPLVGTPHDASSSFFSSVTDVFCKAFFNCIPDCVTNNIGAIFAFFACSAVGIYVGKCIIGEMYRLHSGGLHEYSVNQTNFILSRVADREAVKRILGSEVSTRDEIFSGAVKPFLQAFQKNPLGFMEKYYILRSENLRVAAEHGAEQGISGLVYQIAVGNAHQWAGIKIPGWYYPDVKASIVKTTISNVDTSSISVSDEIVSNLPIPETVVSDASASSIDSIASYISDNYAELIMLFCSN